MSKTTGVKSMDTLPKDSSLLIKVPGKNESYALKVDKVRLALGEIHVKDFGAKGDGVNDDTQAIQEAINLVANRTTDTYTFHSSIKNVPKGIVNLEGGKTYLINETLDIPEGVILDGNNCRLVATKATTMVLAHGKTAGTHYSGAHGGIRNIILDGNSIATKGYHVRVLNWSDHDHVYIHNCNGIGLTLEEVQYSNFRSVFCYNNIVGTYVTARAGDTTLTCIDNSFVNCAFNNNSKYGLWLQANDHTSFLKTDISTNGVVDVLVGGELNGYINSYTVNNGGSGYPISSIQEVTITGDGTEAKAFAEINGSGVITAVHSLQCGLGYTNVSAITVAGGGSGESITANIVDDAGLGLWDGNTAVNRGGTTFNQCKFEFTKDSVPTSGYVFWQRTGKNYSLINCSFDQGSAGTERTTQYCKWARTDDQGLNIIGTGETFRAIENPINSGDYSIFMSTLNGGIYANLMDTTFSGYVSKLAVDSAWSTNTTFKAMIIVPAASTDASAGGFMIKGVDIEVDQSTQYSVKKIKGETGIRVREYATGEVRVDNGSSGTFDTRLRRKPTGTAGWEVYEGATYIPMATIRTATTTELEAVGNAINTTRKDLGRCVFNSTTGKPVWASGTTAASVWVDATGATAHTPV